MSEFEPNNELDQNGINELGVLTSTVLEVAQPDPINGMTRQCAFVLGSGRDVVNFVFANHDSAELQAFMQAQLDAQTDEQRNDETYSLFAVILRRNLDSPTMPQTSTLLYFKADSPDIQATTVMHESLIPLQNPIDFSIEDQVFYNFESLHDIISELDSTTVDQSTRPTREQAAGITSITTLPRGEVLSIPSINDVNRDAVVRTFNESLRPVTPAQNQLLMDKANAIQSAYAQADKPGTPYLVHSELGLAVVVHDHPGYDSETHKALLLFSVNEADPEHITLEAPFAPQSLVHLHEHEGVVYAQSVPVEATQIAVEDIEDTDIIPSREVTDAAQLFGIQIQSNGNPTILSVAEYQRLAMILEDGNIDDSPSLHD